MLNPHKCIQYISFSELIDVLKAVVIVTIFVAIH